MEIESDFFPLQSTKHNLFLNQSLESVVLTETSIIAQYGETRGAGARTGIFYRSGGGDNIEAVVRSIDI